MVVIVKAKNKPLGLGLGHILDLSAIDGFYYNSSGDVNVSLHLLYWSITTPFHRHNDDFIWLFRDVQDPRFRPCWLCRYVNDNLL